MSKIASALWIMRTNAYIRINGSIIKSVYQNESEKSEIVNTSGCKRPPEAT